MATKCNENYIREAAYYLWQNAGCPMGQDEKFWSMAVEQYASYNSSKGNCKKSTPAKKTTATKTMTASKTSSKRTTSRK